MANQRERSPREARDTAELAALLQDLKERSGLTYRALEEAAARRGDVLPRSTLAAVLGGRGLPRPELLAAFVRACGEGSRVDEWLEARARIAGRPPEPAGRTTAPVRDASAGPGDAPPGPEPDPGPATAAPGAATGEPPERHARRARRRLPVYAIPALATALIGLSALAVAASGDETARAVDPPAASGPPSSALPPDGYVRLRPVSAPQFCLTDGRVTDGRYTPLVAVQDPCSTVAPQSTTLESLGGDSYRIVWHHPDYGKGCLKVLNEGTGRGLLEPWEDCSRSSRFHAELSGPPGGNTFVLRVDGQGCVGIRDGSPDAGAEAVMGRCTAADHQIFVIDPI